MRRNGEVFASEVGKYAEAEYFRPDEEYLVRQFNKGPEMLVLGCGAGRVLPHLKKLGFNLTAIDIVPEMVEATRKKGFPAEVMDACDLKYPDSSFDMVFFPFNGIDYVHPDIYKAVAEARRVMKPGGAFIFSSHNRLFVKKLHLAFKRYADYFGIITYRTTPFDSFKLMNSFSNVVMIGRTRIMTDWKHGNWKDRLYILFPFLDKYTYFVCLGKRIDK